MTGYQASAYSIQSLQSRKTRSKRQLITLTCEGCHYQVQTTQDFETFERELLGAGWILERDTRTILCSACIRRMTGQGCIGCGE